MCGSVVTSRTKRRSGRASWHSERAREVWWSCGRQRRARWLSGGCWGKGRGEGESAASEGEERGASRRLQARDWVDGERDTVKQEVASDARAGDTPLPVGRGRRRVRGFAVVGWARTGAGPALLHVSAG